MFEIKTTYKGNPFKFIVRDEDFSDLDTSKITQSYAVIYNENNEILLVHNQKIDSWGLIGGTVEKNESLNQTLQRECQEEAAITVDLDTIKPFFYQEVYKIIGGKEVFECYQVRFIAKVDQIDEFMGDPDGSIDKIKWVSVDEISNYLKWPKTTELIIDKLNNFFD